VGISRHVNLFTVITILLIVIIIAGSMVTWANYNRNHPVEITMIPEQELQGMIYIGDAVNNPGFYPLKAGDNLKDIIQAAGGTADNADLSLITLNISASTEDIQPQKVDLNRAEAWLLQALPGIGEARAQDIIDYRQQNGQFHNINELMKVEGIGTTTYENIEHLITVAD